MSNIQSASYAGDIETNQIYGGQAVSIELQHGDSVEIVDVEGVSDEGMLIDFSDVSAILKEHVHDVVDHAFIVYSGDEDARTALALMGPQHLNWK